MKNKKFFLVIALIGLFATGCSFPTFNSIENSGTDSQGSNFSSEDDTSSVEEVTVGSEGLTYSINSNGKTYSISGIGTCTDSEIIIPSIYQGKMVTEIAEEAFAYTEGVISVYIPKTIKKINRKAFFMCVELEEFILESTLGWKALASASLIDGEIMFVDDSKQAATLITDTYSDFYWVQTT